MFRRGARVRNSQPTEGPFRRTESEDCSWGSMWQNPHILVIDEPTNYLDRDALGALTEAIEQWMGGVVVISHNMEFCNRVATEKWIMDAGHLRAEGGEYVDIKLEEKQLDDFVLDASGNQIDVNREKTLTAKEVKKLVKDLKKKMKDNEKNKTLTDEELWELEGKLEVLLKVDEPKPAAAPVAA